LLDVQNIALSFGGIKAIRDVSFSAADGEITAVIGPNGAGKTSLFNVVSGFYRPQAGTVRCDGKDLTRLPAHRRPAFGIARTFQNIALYEGLSVVDNIKLGAHHLLKTGLGSALVYWGRAKREERDIAGSAAADAMKFLDLEVYADRHIGELPYSIQRRVELARALASRPRLLLLDEPVAGLNHTETNELVRYILAIRDDWGATVILVEHDMGVVMDISDKIVVVNFGEKIAEGSANEIQADPVVVEAYLGSSASDDSDKPLAAGLGQRET
jgi:branched-chain amino acid transport system ATP-binding protein